MPNPPQLHQDDTTTPPDDGLDEGFATYYAEAQRLSKDLNDYLRASKPASIPVCPLLSASSTNPNLQPHEHLDH